MKEPSFHINLTPDVNYLVKDVYKIVNYTGGGSLVEEYQRKGDKALKKKVAELKHYMYFNGDGITHKEALLGSTDVKRIQNPTAEGESKVEVEDDSTQGRHICWKLQYRGLYGESLLHILIMANTETHTFIAKKLLRKYPALVYDIFESEEYYGTSALHLALAYKNEDLITMLLRLGANVNQRAVGSFFRGNDSNQDSENAPNYSGFNYFGEYPLAWAVCADDKRMYNKLIAYGANPNLQDSYGNTVLHVIVAKGREMFYSFAVKQSLKPGNDEMVNSQGLTPMALACYLGRHKIFNEMAELKCFEIWSYSSLVCCSYALTNIDSCQIIPTKTGRTIKIGERSALNIILSGKTDDHIEMLKGGVIQKLIEEKWKTFAYKKFLQSILMTFFYLLVVSVAIFLRYPEKCAQNETTFMTRWIAEITACLLCFRLIINHIVEMGNKSTWNIVKHLNGSSSKSAFLVSNVLILSCPLLRILGYSELEELSLVVALPCSWFFLIFFAGAMQLTGPFISMIHYMIFQDMRQFSIIYLVFLYGFSHAFHFLLKHPSPDLRFKTVNFKTYEGSWMQLFKMTLGNHQYNELRNSYYNWMTQLFFVLFMILVPILLLNMLIAMMGNTYAQVISQSEREWNMSWAKLVLEIEKSLSKKEALLYHDQYATFFKDRSVSALIVLKKLSKSKAKQRLEAIANWKRLKWRIKAYLRANKRMSTKSPKNIKFTKSKLIQIRNL